MSVYYLTAATQFIQDTDLILSKINLILDESSKFKTTFSDLNHILDSITKFLIIKLDNLENDATRLRREDLSRIRSQLTTFKTQSLRVWDQLSKEIDNCRRGEAMITLDKFSSLINLAKEQKIQNTTLLEEALIMQSNCELFTKRCLQELDQFHSILVVLPNQTKIDSTVMKTLLDVIKDLQESSQLLPRPELLPILLQRYSDIIQVRFACCRTLKIYTPLIETIEQDMATSAISHPPYDKYTTNNYSYNFSSKLHKLQKEKIVFTDQFFESVALINDQLVSCTSDTTGVTAAAAEAQASMILSSHISSIDDLLQDSKRLFKGFYHKVKILEFFIKRSSIEEAEDLLQAILYEEINDEMWWTPIYQAIEDAVRGVRAYIKDFNNFEILWNKSVDECRMVLLSSQVTTSGEDGAITPNNMGIVDATDHPPEDGMMLVVTDDGALTSSVAELLVSSDLSRSRSLSPVDGGKMQQDTTAASGGAATSEGDISSVITDNVAESEVMDCDDPSSSFPSAAPTNEADGETRDSSSTVMSCSTVEGEGEGEGAETGGPTSSSSTSLTSSFEAAPTEASAVSSKIIVASRSIGKKTKSPPIEKATNTSGHRHHTRGKKSTVKNAVSEDPSAETQIEAKPPESSLVTTRPLPGDRLAKIVTVADNIWLPRCSDFEDQLVDFRMKESSLILSTPKVSSRISLLYALCFACREAIATVKKVHLLAISATTSVNSSIQENTGKMTRKQLACSISNIANIIEKGQYDNPILTEACNSLSAIDDIAEQWEATAQNAIKMRTKRVVARRGRPPTTIPETTRRQVTYQDLKLILSDPITQIIQCDGVSDVRVFANEMESWIDQTNDMLLRTKRQIAAESPRHDSIRNSKNKLIDKKLSSSNSTAREGVVIPLDQNNDLRGFKRISTHENNSEEYGGSGSSGDSNSGECNINFEVGDNTSEMEINDAPLIVNEKQQFKVDNNNSSGNGSNATTADSLEDGVGSVLVVEVKEKLSKEITNTSQEGDRYYHSRESKERDHSTDTLDDEDEDVRNEVDVIPQLAAAATQHTHSKEEERSQRSSSRGGKLLPEEEFLRSSSSGNKNLINTPPPYKKAVLEGGVAAGVSSFSLDTSRSTAGPEAAGESSAPALVSLRSPIGEQIHHSMKVSRSGAGISTAGVIASTTTLDLTKEEEEEGGREGDSRLTDNFDCWWQGSDEASKVTERNPREKSNKELEKIIHKFNREIDPVAAAAATGSYGNDMIIDLTGDDDDDDDDVDDDEMMITEEVVSMIVDGGCTTSTATARNILSEGTSTVVPPPLLPQSPTQTKGDDLAEGNMTTTVTTTSTMMSVGHQSESAEADDDSNTDDATPIAKVINEESETEKKSEKAEQDTTSIEFATDPLIRSSDRRAVGVAVEGSCTQHVGGGSAATAADQAMVSSADWLTEDTSSSINEVCSEVKRIAKLVSTVDCNNEYDIITGPTSSDLNPLSTPVVVPVDPPPISLEASSGLQVAPPSGGTDTRHECVPDHYYIDDADVILYDEVFKMYAIMEKLLSFGLQEDYNILKWAEDVYTFVLDVPRILDPDIEDDDDHVNLSAHKPLPLNQATKLMDAASALADIRPFIRTRLELLEVIEKPATATSPTATATATVDTSSSLVLGEVNASEHEPGLVFTERSHYGLRCFQKIYNRLASWTWKRIAWENDVSAFNASTSVHTPGVQQEYERLIHEHENLRITPDPSNLSTLDSTLAASKRALKKQLKAETDSLSKVEQTKRSAANYSIDEEIMDTEAESEAASVTIIDKNAKKGRPKRKSPLAKPADTTPSNSAGNSATTYQDTIVPSSAHAGSTSKRRKVGGSTSSSGHEEAAPPPEGLSTVAPSPVPVPAVSVEKLIEAIFPSISNSNGNASHQRKEKEGVKKKCHYRGCRELVLVGGAHSGVYCSDHCLALSVPELLRLMITYRNYLRNQVKSLLYIPEEMKLFEADLAAAYRPSVSTSEDSLDFDDTLTLFENSSMIETTATPSTTPMTTCDVTKESRNINEFSDVSDMIVQSEISARETQPEAVDEASSSDTVKVDDDEDMFHSLFLHFDNEGNVDNTVDVSASSAGVGAEVDSHFGGNNEVVGMEVDSGNTLSTAPSSDGVSVSVAAPHIGWSTVDLVDMPTQSKPPNWSNVYEMLPSLPLSAAAVLCPFGQPTSQDKGLIAPPPLQRVSSLEDSKPPGTMTQAVTRQLLTSTATAAATAVSDASSKVELRVQVQQMLEDHLVASFVRQQFTAALPKAAVLAEEIEDVMYKNYSSLNSVESRKEYRKKFLVLKRNLKHAHNDALMLQLYDNKLSILKLLSMSPNELADPVTQEIRAEQQKNAFLEAKNAQSLNETIENRRRLAMEGNEELWRNKDTDATTSSLPIPTSTSADSSSSSSAITTFPESSPSTPLASQSIGSISTTNNSSSGSVAVAVASLSSRKRPLHPDASFRLSATVTQPLSQSARSHAVRQKIAREMAESGLREREADSAEAVVARHAKDSSKRTKSPTVQELIEITNNSGPPPMTAPPYSRAPVSTMSYFVSPDIANSAVPLTLLSEEGGDEFVIRHPAFDDLPCHAITVDVRLSGLYPPTIVIKGRSRVEVIEEFFRDQCGPGKSFWYPVPFLLHAKSSPENDEAYRRCCLEFSSMRKIGLCHPYGGRTKQIYIVPPALKSEISVLRYWTIPTLAFPLSSSELILYGVALFQPHDPYALAPPPLNPVPIATTTPLPVHNSSQQPVRSILKHSLPPPLQPIETSSSQPTSQTIAQAAPVKDNMKGGISEAHPALKVYPQKPQQQTLKSVLKQSSQITKPLVTPPDTSSNKFPLIKPAINLESDISNPSISIKDNNTNRNLAITSTSNVELKKTTNIATTRSSDDEMSKGGNKAVASLESVNNNDSKESPKITSNKPKVNIFDEVHDEQAQDSDSINNETASSKIDTSSSMNAMSKENKQQTNIINTTTTTINMADLIKAAEFIAKHGDIVLPVIQEKPGSRDRVPFIFEDHPGYQQFVDKVKELRVAQSGHVEGTETISSTNSASKIQNQTETINKSVVPDSNNGNQGGATSSGRSSGRTGNFRILPKRGGIAKPESNNIEEEN